MQFIHGNPLFLFKSNRQEHTYNYACLFNDICVLKGYFIKEDPNKQGMLSIYQIECRISNISGNLYYKSYYNSFK